MSKQKLNAERKQALMTLMDDPAPSVRSAVYEEIRRQGNAGLAFLRECSERGVEEQKRLARLWLHELAGSNGVEAFLQFIESFRYELETGCLLMERTLFPRLEHVDYYNFMNDAADRCRELILMPSSGYEQCRVLNRVLFHEYGFRGNSEEYYDPMNSFLHEVVKRKRGIPVTLSILYILLADRCGLQLEPIALPGHFMVGCFTDDEPFYIDPFARGMIRTQDDIEIFLLEHHIEPRAEHFRPTPTGEILARCCRNLVNQFMRNKDEERASLFRGFVLAFEQAYRNHARHE